MQKLYLNTVDRTWYDADGSEPSDSNPQIPLGNSERIAIQCCTETPNAGTPGIDPETDWTKDTQFNLTGVTALLSADNNFLRHMKGQVKTAISAGTVSSAELTITGATLGKIPSTGSIRLFDSSGNYEALEYTARSISGTTVTFTCASGSSLVNSYGAGVDADCPESLYAQAIMNTEESNPSTGLFVFDIVMDSLKLREESDYADISEIGDVKGLELLIFTVNDNVITIKNAYLCTTLHIPIPMADPDQNPDMPDTYDSNVAAIVTALLANGASVELYNSSTSEWVPYESVTTITSIYTKYRWWLTATGSDSPKTELPLINGAAAGFGTPTASASLLPAGSSPTASVTASGIDSSKVFSFEFGIPKGDTGDAAGFGTPTASVTTLAGNVPATASVSASGTDQEKVFSFQFGIPAGAPAGTVHAFAGDAANIPTGYLLCNGASVSRTDYAALFSAIGTIYGAGNGTTSFNLPDFRGKFLRGYQSGTSAELGTAQGDASRNITGLVGYIQTMHRENSGAYNAETSALYASDPSGGPVYHYLATNGSIGYNNINVNFDASRNTSFPTASENRPANYAVNYIIKY